MNERAFKPAVPLKNVEPLYIPDGPRLGFRLVDAKDNDLVIALKPEELGRLIEHMLTGAVEITKQHIPASAKSERLTSNPVEATDIAFAPGRKATEALVAMRCGVVPVTFAVDLEVLMRALENLRATTNRIAPGGTGKH